MSLDPIILKQLLQVREVSEQALSAFREPIMAVTADGRVYFTNRTAEKLLNKLHLQHRCSELRT
jgi:hypothetical protein